MALLKYVCILVCDGFCLSSERNALRAKDDKIQQLEEEVGSQCFYYVMYWLFKL